MQKSSKLVPESKYTVHLGDKYNSLTVISNPYFMEIGEQYYPNTKKTYIARTQYVDCLCNCGNIFPCHARRLKIGEKTSCGCETITRTSNANRTGTLASNGFKTCSHCLKLLPISSFMKHKHKKDNLKSECKNCDYFRKIKWKFQFDIESWLKTHNLQCEICKKQLMLPNDVNGIKTNCIQLDHNHTTNKIRGILCMNCNTALGNIKENLDILEAMKQYIIKK